MSGVAALMAGIGAAGSLGGAALASSGANKAANAQVQGEQYAADIQKQIADENLAFQNHVFDTQQANIAPWLTAGKSSLQMLSDLLSKPGEGLLTPFMAPDAITAQNDPGYQARLQAGQDAMERSAAARGNLLTGGTARAENRYAQDYASNEYNNVYNRAFNTFTSNQSNQFNRLAAIAGVGQTAAQNLNTAAGNLGSSVGNIFTNEGNNLSQFAQNAAAARASGYVGSANAFGGALSGIGSNISQLLLLQRLLGGGGGGGGLPPGLGPGDIGFCWVAAELYGGWMSKAAQTIRAYLLSSSVPWVRRFADLYARRGVTWADDIRRNAASRADFRRLFDGLLAEAA